ncbi:alpha/beta fold hydrolase [Priestia filamentosa]|uniref:alpha/beta fold hydrolase n=1 Tax=Priestia filamentosa TaxID=1402861 RepID=UPI003F5CF9D1
MKKELRREKMYLLGHSWGTFLGSLVASKYPEHYHAYIGVGQLGRHKESNEETYQYLLDMAIARGDKRAERNIRKVNFDGDFYKSQSYRKVLTRYLIKYGGGMKRYNYTQRQGLIEIFTCKEYTWKERVNIPRGIFTTYEAMAETIAKVDVVELAPRFEIPVYIIQGMFDYQTSYNEAKRFYDLIEAPYKKMFTFKDCAHSPFMEDQEYFLDIFRREILR